MLTNDERAQIRAAAVRECIEALPRDHGMARTQAWENGFEHHRSMSRKALCALLPTPDAAKEMVEEYRQTFTNPAIVANIMDDELAFARWLIDTGRIKV